MRLIVCLDDENGIAFNCRRQSRDRVLIEDLLLYVGYDRLCMTPITSELFPAITPEMSITETPFADARECDTVFCELIDPAPYADRFDEIVIYRWHRLYPADVFFGVSLADFTCTEITEFPGFSHEIITREVWKRS